MIENPSAWSRSRLHRTLLAFAALIATALVNLGSSDSPTNKWDERLQALRPSEPLAYFELAEEIADSSTDAVSREIARHAFALAGALDPETLGRSACLALAELEENPQGKRTLLALASLMGHHNGPWASGGLGDSPAASHATDGAVLAVAEALGRYRSGQGALALSSLRKPGAMDLLKEHERMLPGGLGRFLEDCKLYKGQQRPPLTSDELTRMLQFESALLGGEFRSWDNELILSGGRPLIEVDPTRIEDTLGVNPAKCYYRLGRWVERPDS